MGAPLSALAKQHLMSAGAGAAGGALLGGEGNRMSGAMGGAALGLAGSHAAGPTGLLGRANRAAGEYPPGGMPPSVGSPSATPARMSSKPTTAVDIPRGVRPVPNSGPYTDLFADMMPPSLPPPGLMPTMGRRMEPAARHSDPAVSYSDWLSAPPSAHPSTIPSPLAASPQRAWHSVPPSRYRDTLPSPPPMRG